MPEQVFKANRNTLKLYGVIIVGMLLIALLPMLLSHKLGQDPFLMLPFAVGLVASLIAIPFSLLELAVGPYGIRQYPRFSLVSKLGGSTSFYIPYQQIKYLEVTAMGAFNARALSITTTDYKKYVINSMVYSDFDQIIAAIKPRVPFDAHEVTLNMPGMEDIGERVKYLLGAGVVLIVLGVLMEGVFLKYWHLSSEHMFGWLKYSMLVGIALAYAVIRQEKKAHAFMAALISGALIGAGLNLVFLQANRLHTEHYGQTHVYSFTYIEEKTRGLKGQKWLLPTDIKARDAYVYVYDNWKAGYVKDLQAGHTYQIGIKQGYLNDWAFAPDAFKHAKQLEMADLKQLSNP